MSRRRPFAEVAARRCAKSSRMPSIELSPGVSMFYRDDDLTDPWRRAEAVLMVHGSAESGLSWNAWMPALARRFRVVRVDLRGHGGSTPMPREHHWSFDEFAGDLRKLLDHLGIERVHLIGAKLGGPTVLRFASTYPQRVLSLVLAGIPEKAENLGSPAKRTARDELVEREGVASWARSTMVGRLGSRSSEAMRAGWAAMMGRTAVSTHLGFGRDIPTSVDIGPDIATIKVPTLVITTEGSGLGSVESMRAWQERIPNSELLVFPTDSFHVAATNAEDCATAAVDFISRKLGAQAPS
jgi:3-oxoadipate enol-lactonase